MKNKKKIDLEEYNMLKHLHLFSINTLRTIMFAKKTLTEEEAEIFNKKYIEAMSSYNNRDAIVEGLFADIERDMEYVGIAALEDQINPKVALAIEDILKAKIKFWMLTCDRLENAFNVAVKSRLWRHDTV